ncbi:helix-hairpin-helix domain-containing protein [uncultured Alistipes sp.]|uniref:helix-hairpin-helix domain-containing protein n=1 Tax=uncultured Alistipes sp. TaxID=538949 RepID=UPI00261CF26A|nr:helix-hairpin-helix domain-containing protein [uncultured Alistipes sp.]
MKPYFSSREIRALMIFLPLCVLAVAGMRLARPKAGPAEVRAVAHEAERPADSVRLFRFDPNTIDYAGLRQLGLTAYEAASLLKYRAAGKVFRIPEDVAACYGFTDSLYFRLAPYIRIGRKYAVAPPAYRSERVVRQPLAPAPFLIDTVSALYLRAIGALSKRQAEALVRWRDLHGIRDMEELRECYVVSDSVAAALEPYVRFAVRHDPAAERVELNRADSAALCSVYGIGAKSAAAILRYRERLGGFRCVEQLAEVREVTERNYERIVKQIWCDSCEIQKIDINFAAPNTLMRHPYLPPRIVRKLLRERQLKGGWTTVGELVRQNILTEEEAARLAPYLRFGSRNDPGNDAASHGEALEMQERIY